jgi:miniconductance mechanosensitive channel
MIASHKVATWLLARIKAGLDAGGIDSSQDMQTVVYVAVVIIIAVSLGWVVRQAILWLTSRLVRRSTLGEALMREHTLLRCSHVIPPLVAMALIPVAFDDDASTLFTVIWRSVVVYTIVAIAIGLVAVLSFVFNRYNERANKRNLPIKGILYIAIGAVWVIVAILAVGVVINKSPGALLAGLGAFAAALMLIFKDSILGFVAGIQMSQNDMVRVGDWICVPSTPANGIVLDVSLSTVKVLNFDFTTIMIPPYTIVSTAVQNYRSMRESGVREVVRTVTLRYADIVPCNADFVSDIIAKFPLVSRFTSTLAQGETASYRPGIHTANGSIETNLGLFRAYIYQYLLQHPMVAQDQRIMVRINQPDTNGVPLQIWCYAANNDWTAYSALQSQLTEHIVATAPAFALSIYTPGNLTAIIKKSNDDVP